MAEAYRVDLAGPSVPSSLARVRRAKWISCTWQLVLITSLLLSVFLTIIIGILALVASPGWLSDWLTSGFVVGISLCLTSAAMLQYPQVFDFRTFRLPGILVLGYLAMILLPLPWVYADHGNLARVNYLFVATGSFLFTIAGVLAAHHLFPMGAVRIREWIVMPARISFTLRIVASGLLLGCFALLTVYVLQIGALPIVNAIRGGSTTLELVQAREDAYKLLSLSLRTPISFLRTMLFPFATLMILVGAMNSRSWLWRALFVISLLGNLLLAAATLEKSPVAALLGMLILSWLIVRRQSISGRAMLLLGCAGFAFPVFVVMANYGFAIEPDRIFDMLFRRVLYTPSEVVLAYVDYVPKYSGFLSGRTLPYVSKLFPEGPIWIENIISLRYFYSGLESGNANAGYPGYFWADFGWLGVTVASFVAGVILQGIQSWIVRLPKQAPVIALQALLAWQTFMLTSSSFGSWLDWAIWESGFALVMLTLSSLITSRASRRIAGTVSCHPRVGGQCQ